MTPERFHTLVAAYGADPRRWPSHERDDALAWARAHRAQAETALDEALELDAWLARDTVAPPTRALFERIVATAPANADSRAKAPQRRRLWWSGAAFAGVGLAGALAGALAMSMVLLGSAPSSSHESYETHESSYLTTGFGGSSADWGDE
jgi:hypothetical protein